MKIAHLKVGTRVRVTLHPDDAFYGAMKNSFPAVINEKGELTVWRGHFTEQFSRQKGKGYASLSFLDKSKVEPIKKKRKAKA